MLEVSVRRVTAPLQEFEAARKAAVDRIRREDGVGVSREIILFKDVCLLFTSLTSSIDFTALLVFAFKCTKTK